MTRDGTGNTVNVSLIIIVFLMMWNLIWYDMKQQDMTWHDYTWYDIAYDSLLRELSLLSLTWYIGNGKETEGLS